jgi:hypothetical protein
MKKLDLQKFVKKYKLKKEKDGEDYELKLIKCIKTLEKMEHYAGTYKYLIIKFKDELYFINDNIGGWADMKYWRGETKTEPTKRIYLAPDTDIYKLDKLSEYKKILFFIKLNEK